VLGVGHKKVAQGLGGAQDGEKTTPMLTRLGGGRTEETAQKGCGCSGAPGLDAAKGGVVACLDGSCGLGKSNQTEQRQIGVGGEGQGLNELLSAGSDLHVSRSVFYPPDTNGRGPTGDSSSAADAVGPVPDR